ASCGGAGERLRLRGRGSQCNCSAVKGRTPAVNPKRQLHSALGRHAAAEARRRVVKFTKAGESDCRNDTGTADDSGMRPFAGLMLLRAAGCLPPLPARLDRMSQQLDTTNQHLARINEQLEQTNEKLDRLQKQIQRLAGGG